jgi:hypothetical protein
VVSWDYDVHNITDSPLVYAIPLRVNVQSFTEEGLSVADHVRIEEVVASVDDRDEWIDLTRSCNLCLEPILSSDKTRVMLSLNGRAKHTIPPHNITRVHLKFSYVAHLLDSHIQRMLSLTRNTRLKLNYSAKDFFIEVSDFCPALKKTLVADHDYEWNGWLLPFHGFIVEWKPTWMFSSSFAATRKKEKESEINGESHSNAKLG